MAHHRLYREEFDPKREFVVTRPFVFNGKAFVPGQTINKAEFRVDAWPEKLGQQSQFSVRRMRQLFDLRHIDYPNTVGKAAPPPAPPPQAVEEPPPRFARRPVTTKPGRIPRRAFGG